MHPLPDDRRAGSGLRYCPVSVLSLFERCKGDIDKRWLRVKPDPVQASGDPPVKTPDMVVKLFLDTRGGVRIE
jgi:hypothetical protein